MKKRILVFGLIVSLMISSVLTANAAELQNKTNDANFETQTLEITDDLDDIQIAEENAEIETVDTAVIEGGVYEDVYINPIYADVITVDDIVSIQAVYADTYNVSGAAFLSGESEYYNESDAAKKVRSSMKNRLETISVNLELPGTTSDLRSAVINVVTMAMNHTGNPTEGDYLAYQYAGYTLKYSYYSSQGSYWLSVTYTFTYYTTAEQELVVSSKIKNVLASIDTSGTDYQTVYNIYQYITSNVKYDNANLNDNDYKLKYTAYAALINGTSVCQGYAVLFYRMMLECGIDARVVTSRSMNHGWNIVKVDGVYYQLDSTWDAGKSAYTYFLCGTNMVKHSTADQYSDSSFASKYGLCEKSYLVYNCSHNYVQSSSQDATATTEGWVQYTCSKCSDTYVETIPKDYVYTIIFNGNKASSGSMDSINCKNGVDLVLPANAFSRKGYKFIGWNTMADGSGTSYSDGETLTSSLTSTPDGTVTLYARWQKTRYTISYSLAGGTNNALNPTFYYINTETIILQAPEKTGYKFAGWYTSSSYTTKVTQIEKGSTGSVKLYAKWTPIKYYIKYYANADGVTGTMVRNSAKYDVSRVLRANAFVNGGLVFAGWNTKSSGSGTIYADQAEVINLTSTEGATVKLYAMWKVPKVETVKITSANGVNRITFTGVTGAKGYQLYRSTSETGTFSKVSTVTSSARAFDDKKAVAGKKYYYKVRAYSYDAAGELHYGKFSEIKSITTSK